jgi:hypothetical protein
MRRRCLTVLGLLPALFSLAGCCACVIPIPGPRPPRPRIIPVQDRQPAPRAARERTSEIQRAQRIGAAVSDHQTR